MIPEIRAMSAHILHVMYKRNPHFETSFNNRLFIFITHISLCHTNLLLVEVGGIVGRLIWLGLPSLFVYRHWKTKKLLLQSSKKMASISQQMTG